VTRFARPRGDAAQDVDAAVEPPRTVPRGLLVSTFLRSFTIQGSWNYRTMLGGGFAFALLPLLRSLRGSEGPDLESALARHSEHFNAHPYLAGIALGAVARLELEGAPPEVVERFKAAVRGPLGGLGDTLVWAAWLPLTLLIVLIAAWSGLPPVQCLVLFFVIYNVGHLGLRVWAFRVGFQEGTEVGARLRRAELGHRTEVLVRTGSILLGVLCGLLLMSAGALGGTGFVWPLLGVAAFALGLLGGFRVWRPAAMVVVGVILVIFLTRAIP